MTWVVKDRFSIVQIAVFKTGSDPQGSLQTRYSSVTVFNCSTCFVKRLFAFTPGEANEGRMVLS